MAANLRVAALRAFTAAQVSASLAAPAALGAAANVTQKPSAALRSPVSLSMAAPAPKLRVAHVRAFTDAERSVALTAAVSLSAAASKSVPVSAALRSPVHLSPIINATKIRVAHLRAFTAAQVSASLTARVNLSGTSVVRSPISTTLSEPVHFSGAVTLGTLPKKIRIAHARAFTAAQVSAGLRSPVLLVGSISPAARLASPVYLSTRLGAPAAIRIAFARAFSLQGYKIWNGVQWVDASDSSSLSEPVSLQVAAQAVRTPTAALREPLTMSVSASSQILAVTGLIEPVGLNARAANRTMPSVNLVSPVSISPNAQQVFDPHIAVRLSSPVGIAALVPIPFASLTEPSTLAVGLISQILGTGAALTSPVSLQAVMTGLLFGAADLVEPDRLNAATVQVQPASVSLTSPVQISAAVAQLQRMAAALQSPVTLTVALDDLGSTKIVAARLTERLVLEIVASLMPAMRLREPVVLSATVIVSPPSRALLTSPVTLFVHKDPVIIHLKINKPIRATFKPVGGWDFPYGI